MEGIASKRQFTWYWPAGIFGFCLLLRVALNFATPMMSLFGDEFGTVATAAYLAGYDWSAVASPGYYGIGFGFLYVPFLLLVKNVQAQYLCLLGVNAFLQALPALISYYLMTNCLQITNRMYAALSSVALSFYVTTRANLVMNEHTIVLCTWLLFAAVTVCSQPQTGRIKRAVWTVVSLVTLLVALVSHTRAFVLLFALLLIFVFYGVLYKRWLLDPVVLVIGLVGIFLLSKLITSGLENTVFGYYEDMEVFNTPDSLINDIPSLGQLLNFGSIYIALGIFSSNIYGASAYSGIFILLCVVFLVVWLWAALTRFFAKKKTIDKRGFFAAWQARADAAYEQPYTCMVAGGLLCLACVVATVLMLVLTWMPKPGEPVANYNTFRSFFYLRYYLSYSAPLLLCGLAFLYRYKGKLHWYFLAAAALFIMVKEITYVIVMPFTKTNPTGQIDFMQWLGPFALIRDGKILSPSSFTAISFVALGIFALIFVLCKKRLKNFVPLLLSVVFLYQYVYGTFQFDVPRVESMSSMTNSIIPALKDLTQGTPQTIYSISQRSANMMVQYNLQQYTVLPDLLAEDAGTLTISDRTVHFWEWDTDEDIWYIDITNYPELEELAGEEDEDAKRENLVEKPSYYQFVYLLGDEYLQIAKDNGYEVLDGNSQLFDHEKFWRSPRVRKKLDGTLLIRHRGFIYGPYISIPKGTYKLTIDGQNLDSAELRLTYLAGAKELEYTVQSATPDQLVVEFSLMFLVEQLEFYTENISWDVDVSIYTMELEFAESHERESSK